MMPAEKRCDQCGANNPSTNKFCGECGARLTVPTVQAASPAVSPAPTPDGIPDWLKMLDETPPPVEAPSNAPGTLPSWLHDDAAASGSNDEPPRPQPASAAQAPLPTSEYDLPAWLRAPIEAEPAAPAAAQEDVPDLPAWLTDVQASPPEAAAPSQSEAPDLPSWLRTIDTTAPAPPADAGTGPAPEAEIPAWLRSIAEPDAAPSAAPDNQTNVPDWLSSFVDAEPPPPAPPASTTPDRPSWLVDPAAEQTPAPAAPVQSGSIPAWLIADDQPADTQAAAPVDDQAAPAPSATPPANTSSALPDWLRDQDLHLPDVTVDALPSWLQDLPLQTDARVEPSAAAPTPPGDAGAFPAWLQDLENTPSSPPAPASSPGDLPSWLIEPMPVAETSDQSQSPAGTTPDWLHAEPPDAASIPPAASTPVSPASTNAAPLDVTVPAWLLEAAGDQVQTPPAADATASTGGNTPTFPAWLQTPADQTAQPSQPIGVLDSWLADTGPEPAVDAPGKLPAWLQDQTVATPPDTAATPPDTATPIGMNNMPAHDHTARTYNVPNGTATQASTPPTNAALPGWLSGLDPVSAAAEEALPLWLRDMVPAQSASPGAAPMATATPETAPAETASTQPQAEETLQLPPWLRDDDPAPQPTAALPAVAQQTMADATQATTPNVTNGLSTPASPAASAPAATIPLPVFHPSPAMRPTVSPADLSPERATALQLLERLLVEAPAEPAVMTAAAALPRRRNWLITILQILAFMILVAAILAILWNPRLPQMVGWTAPGATPAGDPTNGSLASTLAALNPAAPVLVAYEWDGTRSAELAPLEEQLVDRFAARRMPLLLLATDPQGALLSRRRVLRLQSQGDAFYRNVPAGYTDLGFQPGGALALARLTMSLPGVLHPDWGGRQLQGEAPPIRALCQAGGTVPACDLSHLGMIVVLADSSDDVRSWVEQVASAVPTVPILFATPAELVPQVQPYLTRPNMHLVSGLAGVLALQSAAGKPDEWIGRQVDATAMTSALFAVIALLGVLPALWSGWRARRRGNGSIWER